MSDNPDNLEKYTWGKDDVEWVHNKDDPFVMSLEDRQAAWKFLHPGEPLPPRLIDDTYYRSEKTIKQQARVADHAISRPKVKLHIHRK
jgi:hypothetical protein